jgi:hypothetical protein
VSSGSIISIRPMAQSGRRRCAEAGRYQGGAGAPITTERRRPGISETDHA